MAQSGRVSLRSTLAGGHCYMFDYCCDLCERDGLQKEAVGFCADCQDYLCTECFSTHLRPKPSRHHVLLDQHQMPKDQQQNRGGDTCTEACATHPHKAVEYCCTKHDELGCSVCMTLNHCNCKGVEHIPDIVSDILNSVEYVALQEKVTSLTHVANTAIQTSLDLSKSSKIFHVNALEDFKKFKKDLSKAVDRIEKNLIKEADIIKGDDEKKVKLLENKYKDVLKDIQALSSKFTSLQNNGQFCQMFIAMKRAKRATETIETRIDDSELNIKARKYRLITNSEVQLFLETPETMVKLEVVKEAQSGPEPTQTATSDKGTLQTHKKTNQALGSPPTTAVSQQGADPSAFQHKIHATSGTATVYHSREGKKARAQHAIDIQVTSTNDSNTPCITGCVVLPGDKLVVVDDKVKLVDLIHNRVVSQLGLDEELWDITQVNSTQVAVTSLDTHTISFVNINANQLKLDRKVKVKGRCRGVASINDKLVVSYDDPVKVEIISVKGKVLHTVISEDNAVENFDDPWYVVVSKDRKNIYISDASRHTVTCVDLTGGVQATYKNMLRKPRGLTVDSAGRVYVIGNVSSNILQLTADLTEIQELLQLPYDFRGPNSVCYCEATDRLFIGMDYSDVVKVYQLI